MNNTNLTSISLFSGAGGMDIGFENSGFNIEWSNDSDKDSCETYNENFKTKINHGLIQDYMNKLNTFKHVDCIFGGPPCQGFSVAGKMSVDDPRSQHVLNFMKIVKRLKPRSFVMENVPSLATLKNFLNFRRQLIQIAEDNGYSCEIIILNSKDFNVSQSRKRMFFIGVKTKNSLFLNERFSKFKKPELNTFDKIKILGVQGTEKNPKTCNAKITLALKPILRKSPYAGMLFNGSGRSINPKTPSCTLPASMGGNKTPIIDENHFYGDGKSWVEKYHKRLLSGKKPLGMHDVPCFLRRLTINEAKLLQDFPKDFTFKGSKSSIYKQIGNSVPANLAKIVANVTKEIILEKNLPKVQNQQLNLSLQSENFL